MSYPPFVRFDLSGSIFARQLNKLMADDLVLYRGVLRALKAHTESPWHEFAEATSVDFYEASFDGSYTIIGFDLLDGEVRLTAQIIDDVIVIGAFHKPIIHVTT